MVRIVQIASVDGSSVFVSNPIDSVGHPEEGETAEEAVEMQTETAIAADMYGAWKRQTLPKCDTDAKRSDNTGQD